MKYIKICFCALLCVLNAAAQAQTNDPIRGIWQDRKELALPKSMPHNALLPKHFRLLETNFTHLKTSLEKLEYNKQKVELELPLPDGKFMRFLVAYDPVMHPELAAKFPEIRSYSGTGMDNPGNTVYLSCSPVGFHALILQTDAEVLRVEPVQDKVVNYYLAYSEKDSRAEAVDYHCTSPNEGLDVLKKTHAAQKAGDCRLRTYRLAMPTTAEFTATGIGPGDPTGVNTTIGKINAFLTDANAIFIRDFGVRFQLVANNNLLIFTNAATDGYTNNNQNSMASDGENQTVVDNVIGAANYDIAQVLGTQMNGGFSGVSLQLGNACVNGNKANAASIMNPANPVLYQNYIMHELGHQLGADHTFNEASAGNCANAGQLSPGTAFEPGSGTTIMSYAGSCNASDVQSLSDLYFHTISIQQVANYITGGAGSGCPVTTVTGNNAPVVSVGPAAAYTIPAGTPFRLTATGSDPDGNTITYCWEQFDNQLISHPPQSTAANGPVFRSQLPSASPTRYFPNLSAILNGTATPWEVLPSVSRTMNFIVTARDNNPNGGCTTEGALVLTVDGNSGPFSINNISRAEGDCLVEGEKSTVSWNVAKTDQAPVNCTQVDIWLSTNGGLTFNTLLAGAVANDGSQEVLIPTGSQTPNARIMVAGRDNVFLSINNSDIRIAECLSNRIVTDNPASGTYKASKKLETFGPVTVPNGGNARFYAGEQVVLKPGFLAQKGCNFLARIQPCDACPGSKPASLAENKPDNPNLVFYERNQAPTNTMGAQNNIQVRAYPNPFESNVQLRFDWMESGPLRIDLYDLNGRLLHVLYQSEWTDAGVMQFNFNLESLQSGVYECLIQGNGVRVPVKVVKTE